MRIRKNLKISPLAYEAALGTVIQTYDCQLNQSPWDAMSFSSPSTLPPPQPFQVYGNGVFAEINGSSFDSISVSHSATAHKAEQSESATDGKAEQPVNEAKKSDDMPIICCKTNGRNWHCRKKAVNWNSFCKHHLYKVKDYNNSLTQSTTKKQDVVVPEGPKRRGRPRKQALVLSSNPNEYYYYMGFCPSWKEKRGKSSSQYTYIEMVDGTSVREMGPVKVSKFADDYIDFSGDEDEEEEDEDNPRKRARKPVKARSLKSLM